MSACLLAEASAKLGQITLLREGQLNAAQAKGRHFTSRKRKGVGVCWVEYLLHTGCWPVPDFS
jgi:hypothetical protein